MTTALRCAAYARYSTDKQNPLSIEDQIRKCREFAEGCGWQFLESHIYSDEEISGATLDRPGLRRLLEATESPARPFDILLVEDTSRLSRKQADILNLCERLNFTGLRICFVAQGIDSQEQKFQLVLAARGMIDQLFREDTARRVHRGMEGLVKRGLSTGGRCFGYRSRRDEDGARLEINPAEAGTVRKIFDLYGSGHSLKRIARLLNAEGVPSPQPQKGRVQRSWSPVAVRGILLNRKYRGEIIWNRRHKVYNPRTGRRVFRPKPEEREIRIEAAHLRIVTDEAWAQVQARFREVRARFTAKSRPGLLRDWNVIGSPYLFSGVLRCGTCGANITITSGAGKNASARYGCPIHQQRGMCSNDVTERREVLEQRLLDGLQEAVLSEDVITYAVNRFETELRKRLDGMSGELSGMRGRREELKAEIGRLTEALAMGGTESAPAAIIEAIHQRERQLEAITEKLLASTPEGIEGRLTEIRGFVTREMENLRSLLMEKSQAAKAELRQHVDRITLEPRKANGERYFVASGEWDYLGGADLRRTVGAGGRNRTAYASLFRAALYQ